MIDSEKVSTEVIQETKKFRHPTGFFGLIEKILLILIPISGVIYALDIQIYLRISFFKEQYLAILLGLILISVFLGVPATQRASRSHVPWYDLVMAGMSLGIALFSIVVYPQYVIKGAALIRLEFMLVGILVILLIIEATRRTVGWALIVLAGSLIFYARFSYLFPAPFYGKGIPWDQLIVYLFLDNNGLLGMPLWVTGSMIFAFILFGQFLFVTGGGLLLTDFALVTMGRFRGGPAKVSVVASGLFGTISGSAVANVMVDGWMTIPMMIKTGYKPEVAAAVEAVASTGGQLMPPVMGVTAFLIAEILAVPYSQVCIAAAIPAVLYYFVLFIMVDAAAVKGGLRGLTAGELPPIRPILKESWLFIIPLGVIAYALFILNFQPGKSALIATASVYILSLSKKEMRKGLGKLLSILEGAGRSMLDIGSITAIAGIVIGVIYVSGLGTIISQILLMVGGKSLFLMLVLTAIVSLILGCGMPTAAVYLILAVLIAPALVQQGVPPMASHLFIFYFGAISMITPPVCLASYAAASIVGANQIKTGYQGVRLSIAGFIVPFIFVYSPGLMLDGKVQDILIIVGKSFVGLSFITASISGLLFQDLSWAKRILIASGAIALLMPPGIGIPIATWILNMVGLSLCVFMLFWEWRKRHANAKPTLSKAGMRSGM